MSLDDLIVITNAFITPEMRTVAMDPWSNEITESKQSDIQWRFDELTHELLEAVGSCGNGGPGKISFLEIGRARGERLANFRARKGLQGNRCDTLFGIRPTDGEAYQVIKRLENAAR